MPTYRVHGHELEAINGAPVKNGQTIELPMGRAARDLVAAGHLVALDTAPVVDAADPLGTEPPAPSVAHAKPAAKSAAKRSR